MVKLPRLPADKMRRSVYYFKTFSQYSAKLKQYKDKNALYERKQKELYAAEVSMHAAAEEWVTLLAELRNPDVIVQGALALEDINAAKKAAQLEKASSARYKIFIFILFV
jgi:hypothetical protein